MVDLTETNYHFDVMAQLVPGGLEALEEAGRAMSLDRLTREALAHGVSGQLSRMAWMAIVARFLGSSQQVFELTRPWLELFDRTDMGSLAPEMLRLPYPEFYQNGAQCSAHSAKRLGGGVARLELAQEGASCPSMYCLMTERGAPPHVTTQYERLQKTRLE